jgi:hypothetical protein
MPNAGRISGRPNSKGGRKPETSSTEQ